MAGRYRTRDPARNQGRILGAATEEFARCGLSGARVDRIAARAGANKRMLYYYFGNKDALFLAALEAEYARIRSAERELRLADLEPEAAIRRLVRTFPMLDRKRLMAEASQFMAQHALEGRAAREVIDDLEAVFARHYKEAMRNAE